MSAAEVEVEMKGKETKSSGGGGCGLVFGLIMGVIAICSLSSTVVLAVLYSGSDTQQPFTDSSNNPCADKKPKHAAPGDKYFSNVQCEIEGVIQSAEQAGANVTKGYKGLLDTGDRAPITWQVDRKCHLISASSFDKLCADMKTQHDDMSGDLYPHGSREVVASKYVANNQANRKA